MYTYYSSSLNRVRELTQAEADALNAAGGDWAIVPAPPPYDPATHTQPQFSAGVWVEVPKTAEELAADADASAMTAEREQIKQVYQDLRNGTGTTAQRFARVERVCAHLIKHLFAVLVMVLFLALPAAAQTTVKTYPRVVRIAFTWDEPVDRASITGYRIYRKALPTDTTWTQIAEFPIPATNRYVLPVNPGPGVYMMTAYGLPGESEPSDPVIIPDLPGKLKVRIVFELEP
jgi:hypothetical protein